MPVTCVLEAVVASGPADRVDAVAVTAWDPDGLVWHAGGQGRLLPGSLRVWELGEDGQVLGEVPAQATAGEVCWLVPGPLPAGGRRRFRLQFRADERPEPRQKLNLTDRVVLTDLGQELLISRNRTELARYRYRDPWKPYFYPVYGPHGNVVRDRLFDAEGHPFHHGLWLAYGTMEGLGANLWCESDEIAPRRGPTGRIRHEAFERVASGWVYGEFVERLVYEKPDGTPFARERRTVRIYVPRPDVRLFDWRIELEEPDDRGPRPVLFACRVAQSMRMRDLTRRGPRGEALPVERPGRLENAHGDVGEEACARRPAPWVDFSGPVEEGWDGVALFDHPANPDFPQRLGAREYGLMTISRPYPQVEPGGVASFRYAAFVHPGDAREGRVAEAWLDFAYPCRVELGAPRLA